MTHNNNNNNIALYKVNKQKYIFRVPTATAYHNPAAMYDTSSVSSQIAAQQAYYSAAQGMPGYPAMVDPSQYHQLLMQGHYDIFDTVIDWIYLYICTYIQADMAVMIYTLDISSRLHVFMNCS